MLALAVLDIALPHYYERGAKAGGPYQAIVAFLGGALCVHALKASLASCDDATLLLDEAPLRRSRSDEELRDAKAARTAWLVTLALAAHNAPEGLAVGVAAAHEDTGRAALMAFAIGMHNVPEAHISVSYRAVPRCCGAFTPSTRLLSIRRGRGGVLFLV